MSEHRVDESADLRIEDAPQSLAQATETHLGAWVLARFQMPVPMRQLFERSPMGMLLMRLSDAALLGCNASALRMLGYAPEEAYDLDYWSITPVEYLELDLEHKSRLMQEGNCGPYQRELIRKDGSRLWTSVTGSLIDDPRCGQLMWFTLLDIDASVTAERELAMVVRTDPMTGLANRLALTERLEAALRALHSDPQARFAVLFIDFDRFKEVNDKLGHQAGDRLLCEVGERLRRNLRASDFNPAGAQGSLVARLGGDEFVLMAQTGDSQVARALADRLLDALSPVYLIEGHEVRASASIGIVLADEHTASVDDLLRDADAAMYEAKRAGRGRSILFDATMRDRLARRADLEAALRLALGTGQLTLVYQPVCELTTGAIVSVEALARWHHPELGPIAPTEFIPIAEDTGLMLALGDWVLYEACRQFMVWQQSGLRGAPRVMSVNLSPVQLESAGRLPSQVRQAIAHTGIAPGCLQLEIDENQAMRCAQSWRAELDEVRGLGIGLTLDNFGTGAISLASLRDLPFDVIKIDRSFIRGLQGEGELHGMVRATLGMFRSLGRTCVAEGVETALQMSVLRSLGCRYAQGYHLGRPLSADQVLHRAQHPQAL